MTRCSIKTITGEKIIGSKLYGKNSSQAKGWCGLGWMQSLGDFDDLKALGSWLFKSHVRHATHIKTHIT